MQQRSFRLAPDRQQVLSGLVQELVDRKWVEAANGESEWSSPAFPVAKPGKPNEFRLVIDYRALNAVTKKDPFPMPNIEVMVERHAKTALLTIFDLSQAFHQVSLDEGSRDCTVFTDGKDLYRWKVMPMCIINAPARL